MQGECQNRHHDKYRAGQVEGLHFRVDPGAEDIRPFDTCGRRSQHSFDTQRGNPSCNQESGNQNVGTPSRQQGHGRPWTA